VSADGEAEPKKKKKDEEKEKKAKKSRAARLSDVSDDEADGGGWDIVRGGIATAVVSEFAALHTDTCMRVGSHLALTDFHLDYPSELIWDIVRGGIATL